MENAVHTDDTDKPGSASVLDSDCRRQFRIWRQMSMQSTAKGVTTYLEEVPADRKTSPTKLRKKYLALLKGFEEFDVIRWVMLFTQQSGRRD